MKKTVLLFCVVLLFLDANAQQKPLNLLIGTYTNSCKSDGIYVYDFNPETAQFSLKPNTFAEKHINPSYLAVSPDNQFVYSVNEDGGKSTVTSFWYNAKKGKLEMINRQNAEGADPCYIMGDKNHVFTANYSGGNITVFGKDKNGGLTKAKQIVAHHGKSINAKRQESPHVHMVQFTPDHQYVIANDLGTDRVYSYKYHPDSDTEILKFKDTIPIKSGSGPRHLAFSPNGKFAYLLQELDGTLTTFAYANGKLRKLQESTVVPNVFTGETSAADIHISEDGKFLYATNRGDANTISLFAVGENGKLALVNTILTGGKGPRNFTIVPGGKFVLVAHQYSNDVVIFKRDEATGELTPTGKKIELCSPVCLVFTPQ